MEALNLLQQWHNGVRITQIAHLRAAAHYVAMGRMLGIPVTIFSVVIGTSIFSNLGSSKNQEVLVAAGIVSMIAAVLSGIQTFLNYPELAVRHHSAGCKYGELRRRIEELIVIAKDPGELEEAIAEIRREWNSLDNESPEIPQKYHDEALKICKPELIEKRGDPNEG